MAKIVSFPEPTLFPTSIFPASTQPPDAAERAQALDVSRSWLVEAPAGSGKTGLIIQRYLKLLADESVDDPAQVLAITFTRKATFELRDRVLAQLDGAARETEAKGFDAATRPLAQAVLDRDRERGWKLAENPRKLNIRTIDSVCANIAGALPVLSRSAGAVAPSEDSATLYAEAARRTTAQLGGGDALLSDALTDVLLHRDGSLADCEALIAQMLGWRDQWGDLLPLSRAELDDVSLDQNVLPRLERALDRAICTALTRVAKALPGDVLHDLCELAADMSQLEGYRGDPSPLAICAGKSMPPKEKAAHLEHWNALINLLLTDGGGFRSSKGLRTNTLRVMIEPNHREQLAALIDRVRDDEELRECLCAVRNLPPGHYPDDQWKVAKSLFRVLAHALVELQIVFADRGESDFVEIGLLARAALRERGALEALNQSNGQELQHLLVDEMQDTSSSQYELIELLTQGWDGHSQTLFLVGDPKQSIYLFRQARVERFVRTMQHRVLGGLQLGVLRLSANFRSQADLVAQFNQDFSRIFPLTPDPLRPERVTYQPARAVLPRTAAEGRQWHTAVLAPASDVADLPGRRQQNRREAALRIRKTVERWWDKARQPGHDTGGEPTMAVLVRNRTHLLEIIEAFKSRPHEPAIPFRAVEVEPLGERQEVLDLVALTRALEHPADRTAWLGLLRSPLCGLTLADLHRLAGNDDRALHHATLFALMAERTRFLSADGQLRLMSFNAILNAALEERGSLPLAPWVDRTYRRFDGYRFLDEEARANVSQYLHLLQDLEAPGGTVEWPRLEARLHTLYAAPAIHPHAVDLMTIHGAKGLEWDVVFVPGLERGGRSERGRLITWVELEDDSDGEDGEIAHGILAPIQSKGAEAATLNRWMRSIETARAEAERKRLFYVACTRARQELHLFATIERSSKGELNPRAGSLLAAAWDAAPDPFESAADVVPLSYAKQADFLLDLAASGSGVAAPSFTRTVERIPLSHFAVPSIHGERETPTAHAYDRPEGSFAARAFGNAVHAFLDRCAQRLAAGCSPQTLLSELPDWKPAIATVLRANGLSASDIARQTAGVFEALTRTLNDPQGRWLLSPHPEAESEAALITWAEKRASLRLDRTFQAGAQPLEPGSDFLWIIDYKTSTHRGADLATFLSEHRLLYAPQLEFYAQQMQTGDRPVRLAIYYPRLAQLDWWEPRGLGPRVAPAHPN